MNTAVWGWPQWAYLLVLIVCLLTGILKHGRRHPPHNWILASADFVMAMFILTAGGFFR